MRTVEQAVSDMENGSKSKVGFAVGDHVRWNPEAGEDPYGGEVMVVEGVYPMEKDPNWRGGETKTGEDMRVMVRVAVDPKEDGRYFENGVDRGPVGGGARMRGRLNAAHLVKA